MIILDCEQMSDEWFAARAGIPTASNFDKIVKNDGNRSTQFQSYLNKCAAESVAGAGESFTSDAMQRGIELESDARDLYQFINDVTVAEHGLIFKDENKSFSCSPDGLVGDDGGLEIKCPLPHTHVAYLRANKLPSKYFAQVQGSLYVTGREWWDFMSFCPEFKPLILRVYPDAEFHAKLEKQLNDFGTLLSEIKEYIK